MFMTIKVYKQMAIAYNTDVLIKYQDGWKVHSSFFMLQKSPNELLANPIEH